MRRFACCLLLALLGGCDEPPITAPVSPPRPVAGERFDPSASGSLSGRVAWRGPRPEVPPFRAMKAPLSDQLPPVQLYDWPNPHVPVVHHEGGLAGAVVFLRGVEARRGKPWGLPPVTVECADWRFVVRQGAEASRVGFVRAGDRVTMVSRQDVGHAIEARGAAFFTYALPEPHRERGRVLATPGVVELASAGGFYWMRAYLFVDDHPYYARTDALGRFELPDVPEGAYELVAWHPSWRVASRERNQDSFRIVQVRFAEPLTCVRKVRVERGRALDVELELGD